MISWSTSAPSVPVRSSTSRITRPPRSVAATPESPPPSLPKGVRAAATMTTSFMAPMLRPAASAPSRQRFRRAAHADSGYTSIDRPDYDQHPQVLGRCYYRRYGDFAGALEFRHLWQPRSDPLLPSRRQPRDLRSWIRGGSRARALEHEYVG